MNFVWTRRCFLTIDVKNQTVCQTGSLFFSKEGREEVRHKTLVQILKFCSWLAETNDEEKFDQAKEIFTDVGTYEDFAGAFILGKFSSGILQNSRSTLWKTTILTRQERLQLFYQKLTTTLVSPSGKLEIEIVHDRWLTPPAVDASARRALGGLSPKGWQILCRGRRPR